MNWKALKTTGEHGVPAGKPPSAPSEAEIAELKRLGECFRRHRIFWSTASGRGVRYVARGATIEVRPHTIITTDLAELREELQRVHSIPGQ